jgi:hypothetical protein
MWIYVTQIISIGFIIACVYYLLFIAQVKCCNK